MNVFDRLNSEEEINQTSKKQNVDKNIDCMEFFTLFFKTEEAKRDSHRMRNLSSAIRNNMS